VACLVAIEKLIDSGVKAVILSRQDRPALARFGTLLFEATSPELEPADHRGAGDSMTAGLASGRRRDLPVEDLIRLACAAGAANVTRHGLGSADADLIASLSDRVALRPLAATPA
jgi:1-phosphofructokinase